MPTRDARPPLDRQRPEAPFTPDAPTDIPTDINTDVPTDTNTEAVDLRAAGPGPTPLEPRPTAAAPPAVSRAPYEPRPASAPAPPPSREEPTRETGQIGGAGAPVGVLPGTSLDGGAPQRSPSRVRVAAAPSPGALSGTATGAPRPVTKGRRATFAVRKVDPWSVFLTTLVLSIFLGIITVVAAFLLYQVLDALGVPSSVNSFNSDLRSNSGDVLTSSRFLGIGALIAGANVVLLTVLATIASVLYNLVASFTGGLELTLADRD